MQALPEQVAEERLTGISDEGPILSGLGGASEDVRQAVGLLVRLLPIVGLLKSSQAPVYCDGRSITPRHLHVLIEVAALGKMSVSELADRMRVNLASASVLTSQLDALGLVERQEDPIDHRRTIVVPGERLDGFFDEVLGTRLAPLGEALLRMVPADRSELFRLTNNLGTLIWEGGVPAKPEKLA